MDEPSIHDQYEEIIGFVIQKCEEEDRLFMTHALTANEDAPACENSKRPARIAYWEDVGIVDTALAMGRPGVDYKGNPSDQFNFCPYCDSHVWVSPTIPIGSKITCYWCGTWFARNI